MGRKNRTIVLVEHDTPTLLAPATGATGNETSRMEDTASCRKERLAAMAGVAIFRCQCGVYHVRINGTTLRLTASQFNDTARLFKAVLGIITGRGLSREMEERLLAMAPQGRFLLTFEPHPYVE